jgi:LSD1 subclass zinc finger protein
MMVRCGACRTQFEVPGAGRFACPTCGSVNVVRDQAGAAPSSIAGYPAAPNVVGGPPQTSAPPPPPPNRPSPRITCPSCSFSFIVGDIAVATCPNCGTEVRIGPGDPEEE